VADHPSNEKEIFNNARLLAAPEERLAYLQAECGHDTAAMDRILELLRVYDQERSFLEPMPVTRAATIDEPSAERPGAVIGPYKLMEQIGEGGMGLVFVAEQQHPVRRKVALKVIKPGMDTRQVVARFEAERQALALMDHPNIAKVLDGGVTVTGRPYFVMELVKGVPITEYCDQNQVPIRERLGLFLNVCEAVQHAHQKGIIHRDIKPSNVLVMSHDGKPVVRVIDFGVAKAIGQQLTDKTIYTQFAQLVGTPLYMSPEQAGQSGLDVDTRSDIYSLGVLLYELLTGTTPFDKERLKELGFDELRRIIREEDPPRPSTRISTLGQAASTISTHRQSDPRQLSRLLAGELDWIVMKALEKDRNRRYETASAFAADIERFMQDKPVEACPPSALYRFRKFARRNKGALLAASLVLGTMLVAMAALTVFSVRINDEKNQKESALETANVQRGRAEHNLREAIRAVDLMLTRVAEDRVAQLPHMEPLRRQLLEDALALFQGLFQENSSDATIRLQTAMAYRRAGDIQYLLGQHTRARGSFDQAIGILEALTAELPDNVEVQQELANSHFGRGLLLGDIGPLSAAEEAHGQALGIREKLAALEPNQPDHQHHLARSHNALANLRQRTGRIPQGETAYRRAAAIAERLAGEFPTRVAYSKNLAAYLMNIAGFLAKSDKLREAEQFSRKAVATAEQVVKDHPETRDNQFLAAVTQRQLGDLLMQTGRFDSAEETYRKHALPRLAKLVDDFPSRPDYRQEFARIQGNLGILLWRMNRREESENLWAECRKQYEKLTADYPVVADYQSGLGVALASFAVLLDGQGRSKDADLLFKEAIHHQESALKFNPNNPHYRLQLGSHFSNLAHTLGKRGAPEEEEMVVKAVEIGKKLAADFPERPAYQTSAAVALHNWASLYRRRSDNKGARRLLEEAIAYEQRALKANPHSPESIGDLRRHYVDLIAVLQQCGQPAELDDAHRKIIAALEEFLAARPDNANLRSDLGGLLHNLALLLDSRGELEPARQLLDQAVGHQQAALKASPDNAPSLVFLRNHYCVLAAIHKRMGKLAAAENNYRLCNGVLEKLIALRPGEPAYQSDLGAKLNDMALLLSDDKRVLAEKRQLFEQAIMHQDAALEQKPSDATYRRFLGHHCMNLGNALVVQGHYADAEKTYRRCLAVREKLAREHPENAAYQADLAAVKSKLAELAEREAKKKDR
jgi:serine/threonine protein kinase